MQQKQKYLPPSQRRAVLQPSTTRNSNLLSASSSFKSSSSLSLSSSASSSISVSSVAGTSLLAETAYLYQLGGLPIEALRLVNEAKTERSQLPTDSSRVEFFPPAPRPTAVLLADYLQNTWNNLPAATQTQIIQSADYFDHEDAKNNWDAMLASSRIKLLYRVMPQLLSVDIPQMFNDLAAFLQIKQINWPQLDTAGKKEALLAFSKETLTPQKEMTMSAN